MNKNISKVAVLGSGIMGSGIACHFANIGVEVLLLDICPKELNENEVKQNLNLDSKKVKNRIVNDMFQKCIKSRPSPIYNKKFLDRIKLGNFEDDIDKINEVDWIIEVVVEKLDIKKGNKVEFKKVLLVNDDKTVEIGDPTVSGAIVEGMLLDNIKDRKVIVFKKRRRQNSRKRYGHRQPLSKVQITKIMSKNGKVVAEIKENQIKL